MATFWLAMVWCEFLNSVALFFHSWPIIVEYLYFAFWGTFAAGSMVVGIFWVFTCFLFANVPQILSGLSAEEKSPPARELIPFNECHKNHNKTSTGWVRLIRTRLIRSCHLIRIVFTDFFANLLSFYIVNILLIRNPLNSKQKLANEGLQINRTRPVAE